MCGRQSRPPVFRHSRIPTLLWERKRAADAFTRWCRGNIFKRHALDLPSSRILLMTFPKMRGKTLSPRRPGVGQKRRAATWRPPRQAPGKGRSRFPPGEKEEGKKEGGKEGVTCWAMPPGCPCRTPRLTRGGYVAPPATAFLPPPPAERYSPPGYSRRSGSAPGRPFEGRVCHALPGPLRRLRVNVERIKLRTVFSPTAPTLFNTRRQKGERSLKIALDV